MNSLKKTCEICNGSGQVTYFRGASRFHLSWEDCPACCGSGFHVEPEDVPETEDYQDDVIPPSEGN